MYSFYITINIYADIMHSVAIKMHHTTNSLRPNLTSSRLIPIINLMMDAKYERISNSIDIKQKMLVILRVLLQEVIIQNFSSIL